MKSDILANLDSPAQLERLYREDKSAFKQAFNDLYPALKHLSLIDFWNARLNFFREESTTGTRRELLFVVIASLLAGLIAKLPAILSIDQEFFYTRNTGFIVFPVLAAYFVWKNSLSTGKMAIIVGLTILGVIFINMLPDIKESDTILLSCMHLPLLLWSILGFAFVGKTENNDEKRLSFLRYNGDLLVMTGLILIAGFILTAVTINLFELIGLKIEKWYFDYVGIFGLAAAPVVGTYLTQSNPQLVGKVSPLIARIFSPLVLVMLVIYLGAIIYSGSDPYNDREFLLIFNALLVGVMAIIFFSVADTARSTRNLMERWILFLLSVITIVVNGIALSAILFRIAEWGITPNRAAVLGANVLMLINLLLVTVQLYRVLSKKTEITAVGKAIASYLPVYVFWAMIVTFLFPVIFGFQ
jgi:hypothetical protein